MERLGTRGRWLAALGVGCLVAACGASGAQQPLRPGASEPQVASEARSTEAPQLEATALSHAACRDTELCALSGFCSAVGGECAIGGDADCRASKQCETDGACSAGDNECYAKTDADCQASFVCKRERRCVARDGYCARR